VPPRDPQQLASAIERMYREPALRRRITERAYRKVRRQFLADRMVREYADLYKELAGAN
jgi:glycosyltransferase involved in cell wall biosynthesis